MENQTRQLPEVTLGQYKGLAVTRHLRPVLESTVEHEVMHQCRLHAVYHPSDQPAQRGDRISLDFEGFLDGEPIPDSKMTGVMVHLGTGKLMPAAEEAIYGHRAGETFRFDFTYPDPFRVEELSGKTAQFQVALHSVATKHTPAPDEAFARSLGYESLDAMKDSIRQSKAASHDANADRKAGAELLDMAGANLTVELPAAALDRLAAQEMQKLSARLQRSGISMDTYCQNSHTTREQLEANYRRDAERRMRSVLAARAIADAENIQVSSSEVENEYKRLSRLHGTPEEDIRKTLPPDSIAAALAVQKVQVFLLQNARVTTVVDEPSEA